MSPFTILLLDTSDNLHHDHSQSDVVVVRDVVDFYESKQCHHREKACQTDLSLSETIPNRDLFWDRVLRTDQSNRNHTVFLSGRRNNVSLSVVDHDTILQVINYEM